MQATANPYLSGTGFHEVCFLNQICPFVNAGSGYIEETPLIGKTTDISAIPDSNIIDIGFHHPNWNYSNAGSTTLQADFNNDLVVDYKDLYILADYWLFDYNDAEQVYWRDWDDSGRVDYGDLMHIVDNWLDPYDFTTFAWFAKYWQREVDERLNNTRPNFVADDRVDFKDFAAFANEWQMTSDALPSLNPLLDKDPNNISGHVQITTNVYDPKIHRLFLFLDGIKYCEFGDFESGSSVGIDTECFINGNHSLKLVCMYEDQVVVSSPIEVNFNNSLSSVTMPGGFVLGKDFYIYALGTGDYSLEILDIINDQIVYTDLCESGIHACINSNVFSEPYGVYTITATVIQALDMFTTEVSDSFSATISREFRKEDYPPGCNSKMVISIGSKDLEKEKEKCWQAALKAGIDKGFNPILLRYQDCTWDNLSYCLYLDNVKIWYHCAHGNNDLIGQPPRQCIETADGMVFSYLKKDLNPVPPGYEDLMWFYEDNRSIAELGFSNTNKLIWVQFNACYSARTTEFPYALGILPIDDPLNIGKQVFIGWKDSAFVSDILQKYNTFEEYYWKYLVQGSNLENAVEDAANVVHDNYIIRENFTDYGVIDRQYVYFRYPNIN